MSTEAPAPPAAADSAAAPPARRRSLDPVFSPRSVAVVGASRRRDSIGFALLHNLVMSQFGGALYPVNPGATSIHSLKCYPSLSAIPDPVDLAVIAVPREAVQAVVEEAVARGVRGLVVITAGFAEVGEEGARRERLLRETVRRAGVRMIGPNCMGVINTEPEVSLNATFAPTPARAGSIGFVSQSGALGVAILNVADDLGIGLTQFVSMGNKADVSGNDLLEHWEDDPETRVVAMYLESFGNPRRFTEIAKRVGRKKPILVVKSGRTTEGARAASSHTGAIAGADVTVSAFLEQCGVLRVNTIEELFDVARAFDRCPLPAGNRVAVVTNAGGPGIMATDASVNLGLVMAELGDDTRRRLAAGLPPEASVANPVDMIASATAEQYEESLSAVLDDPAVDMALAINVTPLLTNPRDVLAAISGVAARHDKPVLAVMMVTEDFYDQVKLEKHHPPVYRFPESAARAMQMLARYAAWRSRPEPGPPPAFAVDDEAVAALLAEVDEGYLAPDAAFRVLEAYGVPVARWRFVAGDGDGGGAGPEPEAVAAAAAEIGFPVVVKAEAPGLVHKSDVGAVAV
ncbi:MAG TPA: CoA-binding protein, partial [Thermoanaerobaculia bacterium]